MASTRTEIAHDKGGPGILSVLWMPISFNLDPDPAFYHYADPDRIQGAKLGSVSWPDFEVTKG